MQIILYPNVCTHWTLGPSLHTYHNDVVPSAQTHRAVQRVPGWMTGGVLSMREVRL